MNEKPRLATLIVFSNGVAGLVDKERAVDFFYMDFSKLFDNVSHGILR